MLVILAVFAIFASYGLGSYNGAPNGKGENHSRGCRFALALPDRTLRNSRRAGQELVRITQPQSGLNI